MKSSTPSGMARQQCSTAWPTLSWNSSVSACLKVAVSRPPLGPHGTTPAHTCGAARRGLGWGAGARRGCWGHAGLIAPALQPAHSRHSPSAPCPRPVRPAAALCPAHLARHVHHVRRLQALVEGDAQLAGERVHGGQRAAGQHDGARLREGRRAEGQAVRQRGAVKEVPACLPGRLLQRPAWLQPSRPGPAPAEPALDQHLGGHVLEHHRRVERPEAQLHRPLRPVLRALARRGAAPAAGARRVSPAASQP
jgi:hypothetical protein